MSELLIKNMVCPRCIFAVENLLREIDIPFDKVSLGKVTLEKSFSPSQATSLEKGIKALGFEILKDRDVQKIEKIKNLFSHLFLEGDIPPSLVISNYINHSIHEDYTNLSHLFSSLEGITIEKYFIYLKIEKVKELLFYKEMNISEIALQLGYSSVQHLSAQFRKVAGMTPSAYKNLQHNTRNTLDQT